MLSCDNADNGYETENDGCLGGDPITAMAYIQVPLSSSYQATLTSP